MTTVIEPADPRCTPASSPLRQVHRDLTAEAGSLFVARNASGAEMRRNRRLDSFQGQSKFYTWLVRIAVNEALMKLRRRKGDRFVSLDEPVSTGEEEVKREIAVWEDNPEQHYSREELQKILDDAVQGLKPDFRTVFILRDIEELSTEETAEAMGISIPAVKSRLLRARLALREKLTRQFKRKGDDVFGYM